MRNEAIRWLDEALWDYETALILHREKRYNASAFYSHQAAEKAVKALLYFINEAPWGHSVRTLLLRYFEKKSINPDQELLRCARELDRHYIPSRYPNALPAGTPHEAYDEETSRRALEASKKIVDYVRKVIYGGRRE
ncbi:HEPN domain-containing protein [Staphylothermus hellenicus]|uniref:HEPN domain protein n=1 Tax=Staphylothermus hellenicus (strain DSM 12710 / JCM 10830 / BK20S6-10-b1 / P8) TaxID=591019 RepID=D7DAI3_STAHD|nr:HEPN domain-containing protein [Staphylothermus hellenicus]ADI31180.1 HEPN domain protein [Staphylothermus hellenicus DSM 12710]